MSDKAYTVYRRAVSLLMPVIHDLCWHRDVQEMLATACAYLAAWHPTADVRAEMGARITAEVGGDGELTAAVVVTAAAHTHARRTLDAQGVAVPPAPAAPPPARRHTSPIAYTPTAAGLAAARGEGGEP